jgi:hypothetical protein
LIRGYINLYQTYNNSSYLEKAYYLAKELIPLRSKEREYFCWGYNFPWEARAFFVPAFKPNMIVSSFIAQAFLDLYELDTNCKWLSYAEDVARFIEQELILFEDDSEICFGYIPSENVRVHNANLMGASLYSRLYNITRKTKYKEFSFKSVSYSVNRQNDDGSWSYGENSHHRWIDNFHTGYNLLAINDYRKYIDKNGFSTAQMKGLEYHLTNHFTEEFIPKYFNTKIFPIDIHNFAQGIITFLTFNMPEKADTLLDKSIDMMYDKQHKYFYYQKNKFFTITIPYMRWAQAWMFYALSIYIKKKYERQKN